MSQRQYVIQYKQQAGQERCRTMPKVSQIKLKPVICVNATAKARDICMIQKCPGPIPLTEDTTCQSYKPFNLEPYF